MDTTDMTVAEIEACILEEMDQMAEISGLLEIARPLLLVAKREGDFSGMDTLADEVHEHAGNLALLQLNVRFLMDERDAAIAAAQ